jgi:energy-coupling factor transporter transmembrane protein EcfT
MVNFISRVFSDSTAAIIVSQGAFVVLTVFGGGIFIPWSSTPSYWVWLQELSVFTQGSRAAILHVHDYLEYKCFTSGPGTSNICEVLGMTFRCDSMSDNNEYCMVKGRMVVHVLQGIGLDQTAPLRSFRFLALIFIISRLCILVVMHYPYDSIVAMIRTFLSNGENEELIDMQIRNRCLDGTYDITHFLHFYSLIVICD